MNAQIVTLLAALGTVGSLSAADITGKITFKGTRPPEKTIDMASDPKCGALHSKPITTRHYVVDKDGGLANVFVYLKTGLEGKTFPVPAEAGLLDQIGCEYTPYVSGLMVGQKLKIKNSDPTLHNVHMMSKNNKEFNFAQPLKDQVNEKTFSNPEVMVKFKCDVHNWMFAYAGVLPHPFYAVSGKDGTFKIKDVPPGKYTIEAYHVKTHGVNAGLAKEITVEGNQTVDFTIEPAAK